MKKKVLITILFTLLLVGCKEEIPKEDTVSSTAAVVEDNKSNSVVDNSKLITEKDNKIKELEATLEQKDITVEKLNNKIEDLENELSTKENTEEIQISKPTVTSTKYYRIVAGSFTQRSNAVKKQELLKSKGFDTFISTYNQNYRVITGSYSQFKNAKTRKDLIEESGFNCFIIPEQLNK